MTEPILDPTPAQLNAAACAWLDTDQANLALTPNDVELMRTLLGAPSTYTALCAINGIDPAKSSWLDFAGDTYRAAEAARRAAAEEATR